MIEFFPFCKNVFVMQQNPKVGSEIIILAKMSWMNE
jgi:hypothetical protein